MRSRRAFWLVAMTLVLPGSAQVVAGDRRLGRLGLRVFLGVLAAAALVALLVWLDRSVVFGLLTHPFALLLLVVVLVAMGLLWAVLFLDAWRLARPGRLGPRARKALTGVTAVMVLVTSGPLLYGGYLVSAQRDLVVDVFGGGARADAVDGRYNVLLMGGDAGEDRLGLRNDTNILVSVDADTGAAVQVGIPRNLVGAPFPADSPLAAQFPDGFTADEGYFNAVYKYGSEHPELFGDAKDPGAEAVKDAVEGVTGLEVQYYALIDLRGFEQLIDAMGGIEVDVQQRVPKAAVTARRATAWIEPGRQRLNGHDALWFARSRFESSDYERMTRQRCVMSAMLAQLDPQTLLLRFQDVAAASPQAVSTDIPQSHLGDFVDLALEARGRTITSVQLVPPAVDTGDPDFDVTRQMVADAVAASEAAGEDGAGSADDGGSGSAAGGADEPADEGTGDEGPGDEGVPAPAPQPVEAVCSA
ncbi:hypothetical protein GCM10027194_19390 [Thalassiella azotivora]